MLSRFSVPGKLNFLVLFVCSVLIGISAYGVRQLNRNIQSLYADRVFPLEQLTTVRYSYITDILACAENISTHRLTFEQAKKQVEKAQQNIDTNWQAYLHTYLTPDEEKLAKQSTALMVQADVAIEKLKNVLDKKDALALAEISNKQLYAAVNPVISKINELVQVQVNVSGELNRNSDRLYNSTKRKFYFLIGTCLLFAFVLAFIIVGDTKKLIENLEASKRKIAASEAKCRAFVEYAGDGIVIFNDALLITDVNKSICNLLGYQPGEMVGMKISDLVPDSEKERQNERVELVRKNKSSLYERNLKRKEGDEVESEINVRSVEGIGYIAIIRDISERKKVEQRIKEREARLTALFDNIEGATALLDADKKYVLFNSRFINANRSLTNQDPIAGQLVYDGFPEEVQKKRLKLMDNVLKGHKEVLEVDYLRNGERVYYRTSFTPVITDGKVTGISTYSLDLTKSKEAEIAIKQSEEWHRALVDNISDAITVLTGDEKPDLLYRSPSVERINGYSSQDIQGKTVLDLIHPEDRQRCAVLFKAVYTNPGVPQHGEFRMLHKKGHIIWIEGVVTNLLQNNSVKGIVINYRDITERKMATLKLEQSEEKHRALVENIGDAIVLLNEKEEIIYETPSVERITGYPGQYLDADLVTRHFYPDDVKVFKGYFQQVLAKPGVPVQGQFRIIHKDGHLIWVEGSMVNQLANESVKGIIVNYRDISGRKQAEQEIYALNESLEQKVTDRTAQLQEANKALESFSYSVSHDLRAPVRAVLGFTKIIEKDYLPGFSDDLKELFEHISASGQRMNTIIDDLLTLSKYERAQLQPKIVDMEKLFRNVWNNIMVYNPHNAVLEMNALPLALADASLIEQVVVNLLSNGVKYSSKKENPVVKVSFENANGTITYAVKDNGAGFDMKNYDKLFGAFQRLHGESEFEGTGVGLTLVKRIIEKHGGTVRADGVVNEGATFYFTLPAA